MLLESFEILMNHYAKIHSQNVRLLKNKNDLCAIVWDDDLYYRGMIAHPFSIQFGLITDFGGKGLARVTHEGDVYTIPRKTERLVGNDPIEYLLKKSLPPQLDEFHMAYISRNRLKSFVPY